LFTSLNYDNIFRIELEAVHESYFFDSLPFKLLPSACPSIPISLAQDEDVAREIKENFPEYNAANTRDARLYLLANGIDSIPKTPDQMTDLELVELIKTRGENCTLSTSRSAMLSHVKGLLKKEKEKNDIRLYDFQGTTLYESLVLHHSLSKSAPQSIRILESEGEQTIYENEETIQNVLQQTLSSKVVQEFFDNLFQDKRDQNKSNLSKPERNVPK